jgi:hypothetical protein
VRCIYYVRDVDYAVAFATCQFERPDVPSKWLWRPGKTLCKCDGGGRSRKAALSAITRPSLGHLGWPGLRLLHIIKLELNSIRDDSDCVHIHKVLRLFIDIMEKNSNLWDRTSGEDGAASSHRTLASASPRLKWVARAAVVLAVLGLHYYIDSQPNLSGSDDPFSKVPDGGVGGMSLFPCADGLECGYIKCVCHYQSTCRVVLGRHTDQACSYI